MFFRYSLNVPTCILLSRSEPFQLCTIIYEGRIWGCSSNKRLQLINVRVRHKLRICILRICVLCILHILNVLLDGRVIKEANRKTWLRLVKTVACRVTFCFKSQFGEVVNYLVPNRHEAITTNLVKGCQINWIGCLANRRKISTEVNWVSRCNMLHFQVYRRASRTKIPW